jgi:NAD-dependent dihydropyrimidine dehydrogenase PreA subunit
MLTIIVSAGQSRSPDKRRLEEAIVTATSAWPDVRVLAIPHLYDIVADGPSVQSMRSVCGPIVLCSWLYERAGHWILDRLGIQGELLPTELSDDEDEVEDAADGPLNDRAPKEKPTRSIHSIDLRVRTDAKDFIAELRRLADWYVGQAEHATSHVSPTSVPKVGLSLANLLMGDTVDQVTMPTEAPIALTADTTYLRVDEHPLRRWYPVIDFSRCTNCMECIDFCLFGVYGVDSADRILVEQPDNCRKGCPACSRVCPANAIMFPQHKTPAIAGAAAGDSSFKIDLSKLFGAPETNEDAADVAARERDEHLILAGRAAVGVRNKSQAEENAPSMRTTATFRSSWTKESTEPDQFDQLIDQLDDLNL